MSAILFSTGEDKKPARAAARKGDRKIMYSNPKEYYEAVAHGTASRCLSYFKQQCRKTRPDLAYWLDEITTQDWINPGQYMRSDSQRWEASEDGKRHLEEISMYMPGETHLYLRDGYNLILEYSPWDDKEGTAYCFIWEAKNR